MAIKMVREPSETPNISNTDDFVSIRYAYGNQDGYVIGKGNELSHSIENGKFKINSGRIVLQGVESDIDANGYNVDIDNINELRYYIVFCKVNLMSNTTTIENMYSNVSFDKITLPHSDDLTQNTTGTAILPLYRFTVKNGNISNVKKIVNPIQYSLKGSNGVLTNGDNIISQKKLIWSGYFDAANADNNDDGDRIISDVYAVAGKTIEVRFVSSSVIYYFKFRADKPDSSMPLTSWSTPAQYVYKWNIENNTIIRDTINFTLKQTLGESGLYCQSNRTGYSHLLNNYDPTYPDCHVLAIYEIIE